MPPGLLGREDLRQARAPRALDARTSDRAGPARRRRIVEGRVEAQAGDDRHAAVAQGGQEGKRRKAAVGHQHEVAPRQPAARLEDELAPDCEQRLVPAALLAAGALGGHEGGEEGQRPDPPCPGNRGQQHQAEPAQAAGLDEVAAGGADRITIDAAGPDALAPAPLDRVVEAQHHRAARRERRDQVPEQDAGAGVGRPGGAVEDAVEVDEATLMGTAHDTQQAGDRASARSQDGAQEQDPGVAPGAVDEQRREGQDDPGEAGGQVRHGGVSWSKQRQPTRHGRFVTPDPLSPPTRQKWPKSS